MNKVTTDLNITSGCITVYGNKADAQDRLESFLNSESAKALFSRHNISVEVANFIEIEEEEILPDETSFRPQVLSLAVTHPEIVESYQPVLDLQLSQDFIDLTRDNDILIDWLDL
ncbi:TPA: hypothetical protein ACPVZG_004083 [Vibrio parahaemolyticus]|uniref:hypothetical protein n=1 Tax=Vibrio parahaemolyticus TaxID=670 RepID=UPI0032AFB3C2